jgi:hypothetical protein
VIDRTVFVLWQAVMSLFPQAAVWLSANLQIGGLSLRRTLIGWRNRLASDRP